MSFDQKVAVITGGARGIGRAIAEKLSGQGATVVIADRDKLEAEKVANILKCDSIELDVTDFEACVDIGKKIKADVLIANAGIVRNENFENMSELDWKHVIDVNLHGVFNTVRGFGATMVERQSGAIVCVSSMCGELVVVPQPQVAYNAAKAGVNMIVRSAAVEWARKGVRVNAVAPGYTATELTLAGRSRPDWFNLWIERTPMGRLGEPSEIADAVSFLASNSASFITGTILNVDGGYSAL